MGKNFAKRSGGDGEKSLWFTVVGELGFVENRAERGVPSENSGAEFLGE